MAINIELYLMVDLIILKNKKPKLTHSKLKYQKNKKMIILNTILIMCFFDSYKLINLTTQTVSNHFEIIKHGKTKHFLSNLLYKFKTYW